MTGRQDSGAARGRPDGPLQQASGQVCPLACCTQEYKTMTTLPRPSITNDPNNSNRWRQGKPQEAANGIG